MLSTFELLPAIDLSGGRVVRLRQGDFDRATVYGDDPGAVVRTFVEAGATWLHVVDLDGARAGEPRQSEAMDAILRAAGSGARVEVAGGRRTMAAVAAALGAGAARVVLGTAAVRDPGFAARLVQAHGGERMAAALDVRDGLVLGEGWRRGAEGRPVASVLADLADAGITTFEVTAIERDGELRGPDLELVRRLAAMGRGRIIASAGIATLEHLRAVRDAGAAGAIVGRALYEGRIDLRAAVDLVATFASQG